MHGENLFVGTVLVLHKAFQGRSCSSTVGSALQASDGILHANLLPSKSDHGTVYSVAVGHSLREAHVSVQRPQGFQNPRFEITKGLWYMLRLRHIFTLLASRALAARDRGLADPLEVHGRQRPGLHAMAFGAASPGALFAPSFNHFAFVIRWQW